MNGVLSTMIQKNLLAGLLAMLPWGACLACAGVSDVKLPPGFLIPWNIALKDSAVEQEFVVTEYRPYGFNIAFKSMRMNVDRHQETERMKTFTGQGHKNIVTKESANTDHPEVVIAGTPNEVQKRDEGVAKGLYVYKDLQPGVIVPVHLRIEKVESSGGTMLHTDQVINTGGWYAAGIDGLIRKIADIKLRPGKYRLTVKTTQESPVPQDIVTSLKVMQASPKTRQLKDNE